MASPSRSVTSASSSTPFCCSLSDVQSPKALGLIVQYEDNNLEEVISSKDGVHANVCVRSTPLQGEDCSTIQQGDNELATKNSHVQDHFWDAQVKEDCRFAINVLFWRAILLYEFERQEDSNLCSRARD